MHSASGTKKKQEKKMQHAGFAEWNHSSGLQGLNIFLHICSFMFLRHIKYRYALFLKLRKILIQQQRSNNIGMWEAKHAKLRNKLCHFYW